MTQTSFTTVNIHPDLQKSIKNSGFTEMTPIQAQSLPAMLEGKDVIAQGKTGSGKTAAFSLCILESINVSIRRPQALVLCPTRELAEQVSREIRRLGCFIPNLKVLPLYGGTSIGPQIGSLEHGVHIIVGTPGRIEDHIRKRTLQLDYVKKFVLDEADRMLDMGFEESINSIVSTISTKHQTLLFSATFPDEIDKMARRVMVNPVKIMAEELHDNTVIKQNFHLVDDDKDRMNAVKKLLLHHRLTSTIIFCNTKREVQLVTETLQAVGFSVIALHGDLDQKQRTKALLQFSNKSISILVATDVAARGIDVDAVDSVINYHISRDPEVHVHRIGRTGRIGASGMAFSLYSEKEKYKLTVLEEYLNKVFQPAGLPSKNVLNQNPLQPKMKSIEINGGKKQKIRAGDILGALTGEGGISGKEVGKIDIFDNNSFVAVNRSASKLALKKLTQDKLKGRVFSARFIAPR